MIVNVNDVIDRVEEMCEAGEFDKNRWSATCRDALNEVRALLKREPTNSTERNRVTAAAAALSFYKITTISYLNKPSSYSAGDIRMDFSEQNCEKARRLWLEAKESISDLLVSDGFDFRAIDCGGDFHACTGL